LVAEVCARISATLVWEDIQKRDLNDVDVSVGAEMGEALLVWSLTLCGLLLAMTVRFSM